jgi:cytidine deaminase
MTSRRIDWSTLVETAESMRARAYAPYSGYRVGTALLARRPGEAARVFTGANIENASYGLCVCAERNAVAAAVLDGATELLAIAVATEGPIAGSPCGMCRQVLSEFARDMPIALVVRGRTRDRTTLAKLLPKAFRSERLAPPRRKRVLRSRA